MARFLLYKDELESHERNIIIQTGGEEVLIDYYSQYSNCIKDYTFLSLEEARDRYKQYIKNGYKYRELFRNDTYDSVYLINIDI